MENNKKMSGIDDLVSGSVKLYKQHFKKHYFKRGQGAIKGLDY